MTESLRKHLIKIFGMLLFITILFASDSKTARAASNLIYNGDFECQPGYDTPDTWEAYGIAEESEFIWDSSVFHGASGHSLNIIGNDTIAYIGNIIPVQTNHTYSFGAWRKAQEMVADSNEVGTFILIAQIDSTDEIIKGTSSVFNNMEPSDWEQVTYDFVTNSNAVGVLIMFALEGSGSVWFDDVSLEESGLEIPAAWSSVEADPGVDRSAFLGFEVNLDGSQSIGDALNYQWRIISKPVGSLSELANSNSVNASFVPDAVGDYTIGLTVSDGAVTSQERLITIRAKRMNDTSDDMTYNLLDSPACISGYMPSDIIPLSDGWVILSDLNSNKVVIINGITGEVAKEYQLNASPTDIEFDFDNNLILATQRTSNTIAKIDVSNDTITYIDTSEDARILAMGEDNQLFAYVMGSGLLPSGYVSLIDLENNVELTTFLIDKDFLSFMKYDRVYHNLFFGVAGNSPSSLYRYSYDVQNQLLNYMEENWNPGSNGQDLAISGDGLHLAFACGSGNGPGYSIFDYDSSNILNNNESWFTDAYPTAVDFSIDSSFLVATNRFKTMLFDVASHTLIREICARSGGYDTTNKVRISRGGGIVFSCVKDSLNDNYNSIGSMIYLDKSGMNGSVDPVTINSVTGAGSIPIYINNVINITIDASGGLDKQYGFLMYDGNTWTTLQAFSGNNSYSWLPTQPGNYTIIAEVRDKNSSDIYDDLCVVNYKVYEPLEAPVSNTSSGDVLAGTSISLSTAATGTYIFYTLDGSTPTEFSTKYTAPIIVTDEVTINAIAFRDGIYSPVSTYHYTIAPKAAEPVANPAAGGVASGTEITLTSATAGATIRYTLDGSTPTAGSTLYTAPIKITSAVTIKAIAVKAGLTDSTVMSAAYTIMENAAAPIANPAAGSVASGTEVSLTSATAGASIRYTLDGSTPTAGSTLYTAPIKITSAVTIKAIAVKAGLTDSTVMSAAYTIKEKAAAPIANPAAGSVASGTEVTLSSATVGASIRYTLDGSTPTAASTLYTAPIKITSAVTIKAISVKTNMFDSNVLTAVYEISTPTGGDTGPIGPIVGPIGPIFIPGPTGPSKLDQEALLVTGIPEVITYGDKPFDIGVSGGSGTGSITLELTSGDAVSLSGNTVTVLKAGRATITVKKAEDNEYNGTVSEVNITVNKAAVIIEALPEVEGMVDYGTTLSSVELKNGKANVPGTFMWNAPSLILRQTGYCYLSFVPSDSDNYLSSSTYNGEGARVKVTVFKQPKNLTFKTDSITIALDQTYQQKAVVDKGRTDVKVTYTSSKPSIAEVDSEGFVTPKKTGTVYITAATENGLTATYQLEIKKAPVRITLRKRSITLEIGKSVTLKPSVGEDYYTTYTFTSSNNDVVSVSKNGKITAKKAGTAIITIKTHNGKTITCTIKVKSK